MKEINTILLPTDFTEDAKQAYRYALEIAYKTGADLHLFHAIEEPYDFAVRVEEVVQRKKDQAYEKLQTMMEDARESERYSKLNTYSEISRGKPYPSIQEKARDVDADLIITGTKGESSIKRILYGNVTSNLILESDIPVLTVPENSKKPYLDRFVFATDYRDGDLQSLARTIALAGYFDAEVHVVHISTSDRMEAQIKFRGFCEIIKEQFDYPKLEFKRLVDENFSKGISSFMDQHPVSMLVITRYKKKFLETLAWTNTAQDLPLQNRLPVLIQLPDDG